MLFSVFIIPSTDIEEPVLTGAKTVYQEISELSNATTDKSEYSAVSYNNQKLNAYTVIL